MRVEYSLLKFQERFFTGKTGFKSTNNVDSWYQSVREEFRFSLYLLSDDYNSGLFVMLNLILTVKKSFRQFFNVGILNLT